MLLADVRELLPIGSVVLLNGAERKLMIFGIRQTNQETGQQYDYVGVVYPEGNLGENVRYMFDHSDIQQIIFTGYSDEERKDFLNYLYEYFLSK